MSARAALDALVGFHGDLERSVGAPRSPACGSPTPVAAKPARLHERGGELPAEGAHALPFDPAPSSGSRRFISRSPTSARSGCAREDEPFDSILEHRAPRHPGLPRLDASRTASSSSPRRSSRSRSSTCCSCRTARRCSTSIRTWCCSRASTTSSPRSGSSNLALTPHQTKPEQTLDAIIDNEVASLKHGIFNLGFIGVRNTAEGRRFADWWAERTYHLCRAEVENGLFTDQKWINFAPVFFDGVAIVKSSRHNVATWNLTTRADDGRRSRPASRSTASRSASTISPDSTAARTGSWRSRTPRRVRRCRS